MWLEESYTGTARTDAFAVESPDGKPVEVVISLYSISSSVGSFLLYKISPSGTAWLVVSESPTLSVSGTSSTKANLLDGTYCLKPNNETGTAAIEVGGEGVTLDPNVTITAQF